MVAHLPLDGGPFRLTLGLRRLDPADWIQVDGHRDAELAAKRELLATHRQDVVALLPAADEPAAELLSALQEHLRRHYPELPADPPPGEHPLVAASLLVQEDLCLMARGPDGWRLVGAVVCFPSRWSLREKLGADLHGIHGPVPGYEQRIGAPTDLAFDRLTPQRPVWRSNWTLVDSPELFQPASPPARPVVTADDITVRVERQTLRRLWDTGAVVFTIRTLTAPLPEAVRTRQEAAGLATTLRTVPPETAVYRGWEAVLPGALAWLDRQAATGGVGADPVP